MSTEIKHEIHSNGEMVITVYRGPTSAAMCTRELYFPGPRYEAKIGETKYKGPEAEKIYNELEAVFDEQERNKKK